MSKSTSNTSAFAALGTLTARLRGFRRLAVAFSGGIDSSVLLATAARTLGTEQVLALIAVSPLFPEPERERALSLARQLGIRCHEIATAQLTEPEFTRNSPERCYICKKMMMKKLASHAQKAGFAPLAEGSNRDDLQDYRPGIQALRETKIISPLLEAGLNKQQIREIASLLELPNRNLPAAACLASRIPFGSPITVERLARITQAETALRSTGVPDPVRVRDHGELCRIEIAPAAFPELLQPATRTRLIRELARLGYRFITLDLIGYRPGSFNPNP